MISLTTIGLFTAAALVLAITPGPDLLYIATRSVAQGPKRRGRFGVGCSYRRASSYLCRGTGIIRSHRRLGHGLQYCQIRRRRLPDLSRSEDAVKQGGDARSQADRPVQAGQGILSGVDNQCPQPQGNFILFGPFCLNLWIRPRVISPFN